VLVGAQVTEAGIVIEILVPWDSVGFDGPPEASGPEA
jgi:hypothetical protein